jgi:anti-anti-sigma regulatory factor
MANGTQQQGQFLVAAATPDSFYVRVVGLATMSNSVSLQDTLDDARQGGARQFIFDLGACSGFDSTFMGILLGVALSEDRKNGNGGQGDGAKVILVNATEAHAKLFANVGIDRLVHLKSGAVKFPPVELKKLENGSPEPLRRVRSMVYAHENLVRLGGSNVEKFGAMVDALKRELGA